MPGFAVEFTGPDGQATVSGILLQPREYTLEAYLETAEIVAIDIANWGQAINGFTINLGLCMLATGQARFVVWDNKRAITHTLDSITLVNDGVVHHLAGVIDRLRNKLRLYVDGVKEVEVDGIFWPTPGFNDFRIAKPPSGKNIIVDDVRLSSIARYYGNFTPPFKRWGIDGATVGYWYMDEGMGAILHDASPHKFNMTLTGTFSWVQGFVEEEVITMTVVSEVELGLPLIETPQRVTEEWAETLKQAAPNINAKRIARVGTEELFATRLAAPSAVAYNPFPESTFVSRSGLTKDMITRNQRTNLNRSFEKYKSQLDFAFAEVDGVVAKRFRDLVDRGKQDFSRGVAERTLRATGVKAEQLGTAPIAGFWLTNDPTTEGYLRAADEVLFGGPFLITPAVKTAGLKAMLVSRLTFVIIQALKAELDPTILADMNATTNEMVQGYVYPPLDLIPFVAGGDSRVDLENSPVKGPIVHIKVSTM